MACRYDREGEPDAMRFTISYRPVPFSGYRVSVPCYEGGEVVTADEHDRLRKAFQNAVNLAVAGEPAYVVRDAVLDGRAALNEEEHHAS